MSFSNELKAQLYSIKIEDACCKRAFMSGISINSDGFDNIRGKGRLKNGACKKCAGALLRGIFIAAGAVASPQSAYHLELDLHDEARAERVAWLLASAGMEPKKLYRDKLYRLYYKESERIEDFLFFIGAPGRAYDLMNVKIMKDIKNNANRAVNCDSSNIRKLSLSAARQRAAISRLMESGEFEGLSDELKRTALLRMENTELSLAELCELFEPKLSKSGLNHRINKLMEAAGKIAEKM